MRILIADDEATSRRFLESTLIKWGYEVIVTRGGGEALAILQQEESPRLAILDVMMPEIDGLEVCRSVRQSDRPCPTYIILLTSRHSRGAIVAGLEAGADDYLAKPFNHDELHARIKVGVRMLDLQERLGDRVRELERAESELRRLSLTDDLTGLWNRRGFVVHVEQYLKTARRTGSDLMLFYADMDGLKEINDTLGHREGSLAIIGVAKTLTQTFRSPDIIARLGGDEFAVLAAGISDQHAKSIGARLNKNLADHGKNLADHNLNGRHRHKLSLSLGIVRIEAENSATIEEIVAQADRLMYQQKRKKTAVASRQIMCPSLKVGGCSRANTPQQLGP